MSSSFLLTDEPWIPYVGIDGDVGQMGLRELFRDADKIKDIVDQSPLVTASIYRLVLTINQRSLGEVDEDRREEMWQWKPQDHPAIGYLEKLKDRFNLLDNSRPFYQSVGFASKKKTSVHKLAPERSAGNNKVIFDHRYDDDPRPVSMAVAARMVISCQAFALGGGKSDTTNFTHAPLVGKCLVLLRGSNLYETILLNTLDYSPEFPLRPLGSEKPAQVKDLPAWERDEDESPGIDRSPIGYLDYLTWQSRAISLEAEEGGVRWIKYAQGIALREVDGLYDPMVSYRLTDKNGWRPIGLDIDKEPWRGLSALLQLRTKTSRPPQNIESASIMALRGRLREGEEYNIKVFGMVNDKASVKLWRGTPIPLPLRYLKERALIARVERALEIADDHASTLNKALWTYAVHLLKPGGNADKNDVGQLVRSFDSVSQYWSGLELPFYSLVKKIAESQGDHASDALILWYEQCKNRAQQSLEMTIEGRDVNARSLKAGVFSRMKFGFHQKEISSKYEEVLS